MKFHTPPARDRIYRFQMYFKIVVSVALFCLGLWHVYSGYQELVVDQPHRVDDGILSLFFSLIFFGLSVFLYQNRTNNTPRYDGFEP